MCQKRLLSSANEKSAYVSMRKQSRVSESNNNPPEISKSLNQPKELPLLIQRQTTRPLPLKQKKHVGDRLDINPAPRENPQRPLLASLPPVHAMRAKLNLRDLSYDGNEVSRWFMVTRRLPHGEIASAAVDKTSRVRRE